MSEALNSLYEKFKSLGDINLDYVKERDRIFSDALAIVAAAKFSYTAYQEALARRQRERKLWWISISCAFIAALAVQLLNVSIPAWSVGVAIATVSYAWLAHWQTSLLCAIHQSAIRPLVKDWMSLGLDEMLLFRILWNDWARKSYWISSEQFTLCEKNDQVIRHYLLIHATNSVIWERHRYRDDLPHSWHKRSDIAREVLGLFLDVKRD